MFYTYRKYFIEIFALSIFVMKDVCVNSADYPTLRHIINIFTRTEANVILRL